MQNPICLAPFSKDADFYLSVYFWLFYLKNVSETYISVVWRLNDYLHFLDETSGQFLEYNSGKSIIQFWVQFAKHVIWGKIFGS